MTRSSKDSFPDSTDRYPDDVVFLYVTAPDERTATDIAGILVREKLAACVNIFPPCLSIYEWNDTVEQTRETVFLVKTCADRSDAVCERIRTEHPATIPCIAALSVNADGSNREFLRWIHSRTLHTGPAPHITSGD